MHENIFLPLLPLPPLLKKALSSQEVNYRGILRFLGFGGSALLLGSAVDYYAKISQRAMCNDFGFLAAFVLSKLA